MIIRWAGFQGENRALEPKLLPDAVGTVSRNHKPGRGDLRPWKLPLPVASVPAGRQTIYRMGRDVASDAQYWLSWPTVVHAIRGFSSDDTTERTYYTGDGEPKVTDNTIALAATPYPTANRPMWLPAPATPMLVQTNAGTGTGLDETYFYTYTYVNDWGWESAPAPPSLINTRKADLTAALSAFAAPPSGNFNINRIRIYRTQTGAAGGTSFFFLREVTLGTTTTQDDNRALGEPLATTNWLRAPADLKYLTSLWNGMAAGISGNAVRFSEPFVPYAWPIEYEVIPPDSEPVALGVAGQSLLVLTNGRPLLVAGSGPDGLDQQPLEFSQACIAPRSAVSMGAGVAWASNDGLCWYGAGGARVLTMGVMTREDWLALRPETIIGQRYEGLYFGSYDDGTGRKGFFIDPLNPTGLYFLDTGYQAMHFDELQDQLYVVAGTSVQRWDSGATPMTVRARSKVFKLPSPTNLGAAEVVASNYPVILRLDAVNMNPATVAKLVTLMPALFSAPTPTSVRYTRSVPSRDPVPLPSGFLEAEWQLEVESTGAVQGIAVASSMAELSQV